MNEKVKKRMPEEDRRDELATFLMKFAADRRSSPAATVGTVRPILEDRRTGAEVELQEAVSGSDAKVPPTGTAATVGYGPIGSANDMLELLVMIIYQ